jgi:hypothetical protein
MEERKVSRSLKVLLKNSPANLKTFEKPTPWIIENSPSYIDSFLLLEDRITEEVEKWTQELIKKTKKEPKKISEECIVSTRKIYEKPIYPAEFICYEQIQTKKNKVIVAHLDYGDEYSIVVAGEYYKWLTNQCYELYVIEQEKPLILKRNNKMAGMLMPCRLDYSRRVKDLKKCLEEEGMKMTEKINNKDWSWEQWIRKHNHQQLIGLGHGIFLAIRLLKHNRNAEAVIKKLKEYKSVVADECNIKAKKIKEEEER